MLLSQYLRSIIRDPETYTTDDLQVDKKLSEKFRGLLELSEKQVREYGLNLEWRLPLVLTPGAKVYKGGAGGNSVNLECAEASQRLEYIGDFHTHPYREKYGEGIAVGPSNGDWVQWFQTPPRYKRVAVHCVASGGELFVLIFRTLPRAGSNPDFDGINPDAGRINTLARENDQLGLSIYDALNDLSRASTPEDIRQAGAGHRAALRQHAPRLPAMHAEDAEAMNVQLANRYHYEYYRGALPQRGSATVALRSSRAKGNWVTSQLWSSAKDPWVNLPSWWKR